MGCVFLLSAGTIQGCPPKRGAENYQSKFEDWAREFSRSTKYPNGEERRPDSEYNNVATIMSNFFSKNVAHPNGLLIIANSWEWCPDGRDCVARVQAEIDMGEE